MGEMVYQHLLKVHRQVPFGFADCYELWLLDTQHHDNHHTQLIEAFLQWQAPWLLLLQHLDDAT